MLDNRCQLEKGQINTNLEKSYINKDSKIYLLTVKTKLKSDYFIADMADMAATAKITKEMHNDCNDVFLKN